MGEMRLCECGCGETVRPKKRFRHGHWWRSPEGILRNSAIHRKEGRTAHGDGYYTVRVGIKQGHALEHRIIAEAALGRELPRGVEVHHVDGDRGNNARNNLVICQDAAYHQLLEMRTRALKACGHATWRKCTFCQQWDAPESLYIPRNGTVEHRACGRIYRRQRMDNRRRTT